MNLRDFLLTSDQFTENEKVFHQKNLNTPGNFGKKYLSVRQDEGRVYDDDVVKRLPAIERKHPLHKEWTIRKKSAIRLLKYLKKKGSSCLLEVGCGNGWLTSMLASGTNAEAIGLDINLPELRQAARVFRHDNISFVCGDILSNLTLPMFDSIVIASSIQYFPDLKSLIGSLRDRLMPGGCLHIIDSPFYNDNEIETARQRSRKYFEKFDVNNDFYFHHRWNDLKKFDLQVGYDPRSAMNQLSNLVTTDSPFPWIIIKK